MKHTPYGYEIVDGRAAVDEKKAIVVRQICLNYLNGMSLMESAEKAGLKMSHAGVKRMLQNRKYLGDGFYPPILTEQTIDRIEEERLRREKKLGRDKRKKKEKREATAQTVFTMLPVRQKFQDAVKQAEYAYSQIESR